MRILLASTLLILPLALPAAAQAPSGIKPIYAGVYDAASQRLLPPGSAGVAGADGGGLLEVFANDADWDGTENIVTSDAIELNWGELSSGGNNAILRVDMGYTTRATSPVDAELRLHSGITANGNAGKGITVPLSGLPASPDGQTTAYVVSIDLGTPFVAADGANVGYGLYFPTVTDGGLSGHLTPVELGDAKNKTGVFRVNGDHILDYNANTYCVLYGAPPEFAEGGVIKTLQAKDSLRGLIETDGEVDVARYDGLEGERLDVSVAGSDGLLPLVSVLSLPDETVLASAGGGGESKLKIKGIELPSHGSYDIRVSGAPLAPGLGEGEASTGSYQLKVKGKAPKSAKKPAVADAPQAEGGPLTSFHANAGALFSAVVKPGAKGAGEGTAPVLVGPLGAVDLGDHLSSKNGVHKIKKLPLPVPGGYVLEAGADPGGQVARASVRVGKVKSGKLDELDRGVLGAWIADDFVAPQRSKRVSLVPSKGGDSEIVSVLGQYVVNPNNGNIDEYVITIQQRLKSWDVAATNSGRVLSWQVNLPVQVDVDGVPSDPGGTLVKGSESNSLQNPDGDPDRILLVEAEEVWRRDVYAGPAAPVVEDLLATDPTDTGEAGVSLPGLRIDGPGSATKYQIFKGTSDMFVPGPLYAIITANGAGEGGATEWVDLGGDASPVRYWVRSVDANNVVSAHSLPVDVAP